MLNLINPIYDRTSSDVIVIEELKNKISLSGWSSLSEEEKAVWFFGEQFSLLSSADGEVPELYLYTADGNQLFVGTQIVKGCLNITDLNRIEYNTWVVHEILNENGYYNSIIEKSGGKWVETDFPKLSEFDRIKQNVLNLVTAFYNVDGNPTLVLGKSDVDYRDINDIEKVIYNTYYLIYITLSSAKYSGAWTCGVNFEF